MSSGYSTQTIKFNTRFGLVELAYQAYLDVYYLSHAGRRIGIMPGEDFTRAQDIVAELEGYITRYYQGNPPPPQARPTGFNLARTGTIQTRRGPAQITFNELTDTWDVRWRGQIVGWFTDEDRHRYAHYLPENVARMIERFEALEAREKETASSGEHRKKDQGNGEPATRKTGKAAPKEGADPGAEPGADPGEAQGEGESPGVILAGWRGWHARGGALMPMTVNKYGAWNMTEINHSRCPYSEGDAEYGGITSSGGIHSAPGARCQCGFWAYRSWELMQRHGSRLPIHGIVALGGKRQEHQFGVRSAAARIIALLDSEVAWKLKALYEGTATPDYRYSYFDENSGHMTLGALSLPSPRPKFPLPILSMAECELLAMDQGCVFEPEPPEAAPPDPYSIHLYSTQLPHYGTTHMTPPPPPVYQAWPQSWSQVVPSTTTSKPVPLHQPQHGVPSSTRTVGQYLIRGKGLDPSLSTSVAQANLSAYEFEFAKNTDVAPSGPCFQVDGLLDRYPNDDKIDLQFDGQIIRLVRSEMILSAGGRAHFWRLSSGLNSRDLPLGRAVEKHGSEWLREYVRAK